MMAEKEAKKQVSMQWKDESRKNASNKANGKKDNTPLSKNKQSSLSSSGWNALQDDFMMSPSK